MVAGSDARSFRTGMTTEIFILTTSSFRRNFHFWHAPEFHRKGRRGRKGIREMYPEIDFGNGLNLN
jgi:hypothetical protein